MNINVEKIFQVTCRITVIAAIDVIPLHKFGFGFEAFARITSTSQPKFKFFVLNSDGFLPQSDAPGISFSSRNGPLDIFDKKLERVASILFLIPWPYLPRSDAVSYHSA